jgi:hypothetical protein
MAHLPVIVVNDGSLFGWRFGWLRRPSGHEIHRQSPRIRWLQIPHRLSRCAHGPRIERPIVKRLADGTGGFASDMELLLVEVERELSESEQHLRPVPLQEGHRERLGIEVLVKATWAYTPIQCIPIQGQSLARIYDA